eukprot:scaffold2134_cov65-Phaeocystis_antarctica.AAC.3
MQAEIPEWGQELIDMGEMCNEGTDFACKQLSSEGADKLAWLMSQPVGAPGTKVAAMLGGGGGGGGPPPGMGGPPPGMGGPPPGMGGPPPGMQQGMPPPQQQQQGMPPPQQMQQGQPPPQQQPGSSASG